MKTKSEKARNERPAKLKTLLLVLFVAAAVTTTEAHATTIGIGAGNGAVAFCNNFIGQTALSNNSASIYAVNNIIVVSLLLLLLMINIAALMYLLGSAVKLPQLVNFGKTEIGEVIVTAIVVFIFIGGFEYESTLPTPASYLALAPGVVSEGIFQSDCASLAGGSLTAISQDVLPLAVEMDLVQLVSSIHFNALVTYEGIESVSPYAGLGIAQMVYGRAVTVVVALIGLPLAGAAILAIFYAIAPLFLYLGIILRTVPFTRAAGGAFLGMFVSFYILFPLLLYLLISNVTVATTTVQITSIQRTVATLTPGLGGIQHLTAVAQVVGATVDALSSIEAIIAEVIAQMFYLVASLALALLISFDFMERVGDLLGAPSLSSSITLRNIV